MKRSLLLILAVLVIDSVYAQNIKSIPPEVDIYIEKEWDMITDAGFGYTLKFDNDAKTFQLYTMEECTRIFRTVINGKFKIKISNNVKSVSLIFNDFIINYIIKYPADSHCTSGNDRLTESDNKCMIEVDSNGYPLNYVMIIKEVKMINKKENQSQYFEDLTTHCFELVKEKKR